MTLQPLIPIPSSDRDLLDECEVTTFRASGKGGQHLNKTDSAVRLIHQPTGIITVCQKERSQYLNKQECLQVLRRKLEKLNYRKEPRIPTKVSRSARKKRVEAKLKRSVNKSLRKKPGVDE